MWRLFLSVLFFVGQYNKTQKYCGEAETIVKATQWFCHVWGSYKLFKLDSLCDSFMYIFFKSFFIKFLDHDCTLVFKSKTSLHIFMLFTFSPLHKVFQF